MTSSPIAIEPDLCSDARPVRIDSSADVATAAAPGVNYETWISYPGCWQLGTVGFSRLRRDLANCLFYAYPDQRLRPAPEPDQPAQQTWGWAIGALYFIKRRRKSIREPTSDMSIPGFQSPTGSDSLKTDATDPVRDE